MSPLFLLMACSAQQPEPAPAALADDPWQAIPLDKDRWPGWASSDLQRRSALMLATGGTARAYKVLGPLPQDPDHSWKIPGPAQDLWRVEERPQGGSARIWEVELFGAARPAHGEPVLLQPSGISASGVVQDTTVEGRLELGSGAWTFRCLGEGADLSEDGWCLSMFARSWIETYQGSASGEP